MVCQALTKMAKTLKEKLGMEMFSTVTLTNKDGPYCVGHITYARTDTGYFYLPGKQLYLTITKSCNDFDINDTDHQLKYHWTIRFDAWFNQGLDKESTYYWQRDSNSLTSLSSNCILSSVNYDKYQLEFVKETYEKSISSNKYNKLVVDELVEILKNFLPDLSDGKLNYSKYNRLIISAPMDYSWKQGHAEELVPGILNKIVEQFDLAKLVNDVLSPESIVYWSYGQSSVMNRYVSNGRMTDYLKWKREYPLADQKTKEVYGNCFEEKLMAKRREFCNG